MDRDAQYAAYVTARWDLLVRSAVLLGCPVSDAEDLVQTALVRCYTSWDKVTGADSPDAYVYRILVNCLAKSRRRRWWGETPAEHVPESRSPDPADDIVARAEVRGALAGVGALQRAVLVLRFFADLSERQVAEALRIPVGTVKSRTARGLEQLSRLLEPAGRDVSEDSSDR